MNFLANVGLITIIIIATYFIIFSVGLARVFKQAHIPAWRAFIPAFNFFYLVRLVGLPRNYFWYSLIPYVGTLYAFAVMNRLSRSYGRNIIFTSVWLTFAAAVGIHVMLRNSTLDMAVFTEPTPNLDALRVKARKKKHTKK